MTPIFNTNREYPMMHVWCKFGDSSSNLWRVIVRTRFTDGQADRRRQRKYPFGLKGQGVKRYGSYRIKHLNFHSIEISWFTWNLHPTVIPRSHRTATSLRSAKSARSLLIAAGSLWDPIERRGSAPNRSKISKVTEVAAKFWTCSKQAQWGHHRNRSLWHRS